MKRIVALALVAVSAGCGGTLGTDDGVGSEVATSVVSGAVNNTSGSTLGWNVPQPKSRLDSIIDLLNPIRTAQAASWTCMGGTLDPAFAGPGKNPYTFTPLSCSVTWRNGRSASSEWSSTFTLNYGESCDSRHVFIENQAPSCSLTRTTAAGGNTRTITGPLGNSLAVTHDTNGAGTGWDTTVSPAPSNGGVVTTCGADGCQHDRTLVINGSHITGTVSRADGAGMTKWDHTVSTGANGLTVSGAGVTRTVSGTVTVQHNLAKFTSTTTFNDVKYAGLGCCFPTSGSVTTTFVSGPNAGKSETLTFSDSCGEATLTTAAGSTASMTLQHCL